MVLDFWPLKNIMILPFAPRYHFLHLLMRRYLLGECHANRSARVSQWIWKWYTHTHTLIHPEKQANPKILPFFLKICFFIFFFNYRKMLIFWSFYKRCPKKETSWAEFDVHIGVCYDIPRLNSARLGLISLKATGTIVDPGTMMSKTDRIGA